MSSAPYSNCIREKRTALGLSQRGLATIVGTSQQQVQRIEAGIQTARLELAAKIAAALNSPLAEVFPRILKVPRASKGRRSKRPGPVSDKDLAKAGIETDPRQWTLRIGFEGGRESDYSISGAEKERVSSILWDRTFDLFVFDTDTKRVAINRVRINYAHFLFDVGIVEEEDTEPHDDKLIAYFAHSNAPTEFGVVPDCSDMIEDEQGSASQLQRVFFHLEGLEAKRDEIVHFDDEDGERVFLRTAQIAALEVPLLCCEPALWNNYLENPDEDHVDTKSSDREDVATAANGGQS